MVYLFKYLWNQLHSPALEIVRYALFLTLFLLLLAKVMENKEGSILFIFIKFQSSVFINFISYIFIFTFTLYLFRLVSFMYTTVSSGFSIPS